MTKQSSKKEYRIVSSTNTEGKRRYRIEWRWLDPGLFRSSGWAFKVINYLYSTEVWESSTCHDAECAIDTYLREDDPAPWVVVTCGEAP